MDPNIVNVLSVRPSPLCRHGGGEGGRGTRPGWSDVTGVATSQCRSLTSLSPSIPLITHTVSLFLSSHSQPFPFLHSRSFGLLSLSLDPAEPAVSGRFLSYADDSFTRLAVCSSFPSSSSSSSFQLPPLVQVLVKVLVWLVMVS